MLRKATIVLSLLTAAIAWVAPAAEAQSPPLCPAASWYNYGPGLAGTLGVPDLLLTAPPRIGTVIGMYVENSKGSTTLGLLFVGSKFGATPSIWGGTLLMDPTSLIGTALITIPPGGLTIPLSIPGLLSICGETTYNQVIQRDPAAPRFMSFTRGLTMTIGL